MEPPMKKNYRKLWKEEDMKTAIEVVRQNKMSIKKASDKFNVPRTTLQRCVNYQLDPEDAATMKLGRKPIFEIDLEEKLVQYALLMKDKFYGITRNDLQKMAYAFAKKHNVEDHFGSSMSAGRRWLVRFLERHKNLIEFTSYNMYYFADLEYSDKTVRDFFNNMKRLYIQYQYPADRIFNVEVTSLLVLQIKNPAVFICKGSKRISSLTSKERKGLITMIVSMSASGFFVPPMLIFPEENMNVELMNGAPPCSIGAAHPTGWVENCLFTEWFIHFIEKVKPTQESPVLLILDGQYSYTRNLEIITMAEENHIEIVSVIPSLESQMQPLVETFIQPLKELYIEEVEKWSLKNDREIESSDLAEIYGKAYLKIRTGKVAVDGFRSTGIYPLDQAILLNRFSHKVKLENAANHNKTVTKESNFNNNLIKFTNQSQNPVPGPSRMKEGTSESESMMPPVTQIWLEAPSIEFSEQTLLSQNTISCLLCNNHFADDSDGKVKIESICADCS